MQYAHQTCPTLTQDASGRAQTILLMDCARTHNALSDRSTAPCTLYGASQPIADQDGFSLLELVIAVSIMLILGIVGFVSYQSYTDNARQAAVDTASHDVLTAVVAAVNTHDGNPAEVVAAYNDTSPDIMVDITAANQQGIMVEAMTCHGDIGTAVTAGNYERVETTAFRDITYAWLGEPERSASVKKICDEVVDTNVAPNPHALSGDGWTRSIPGVWSSNRVAINDHPLGLNRAVQGRLLDPDYYSGNIVDSMTIYDIGAIPNTPQEYYMGVWVKTDTPAVAYFASYIEPIELPVNEWVFVTTGNQKIERGDREYTLSGFRVRHASNELAAQATSWTTGAVVSYDHPVTAYFDGDSGSR